MSLRLSTLAAVFILAGACAQAAPVSSGQLGTISVSGVDYAVSVLYDSAGDPLQQTYEVLRPAIPFDFVTSLMATNALMASFDLGFDWNPSTPAVDGARLVFHSDDVAETYLFTYVGADSPEGLTAGMTYRAEWCFADASAFLQFEALATPPAPIPEPQTYALMLAGLAGLALAARRRKAG